MVRFDWLSMLQLISSVFGFAFHFSFSIDWLLLFYYLYSNECVCVSVSFLIRSFFLSPPTSGSSTDLFEHQKIIYWYIQWIGSLVIYTNNGEEIKTEKKRTTTHIQQHQQQLAPISNSCFQSTIMVQLFVLISFLFRWTSTHDWLANKPIYRHKCAWNAWHV